MNTLKVAIAVIFCNFSMVLNAQNEDFNTISSEIEAVSMQEEKAFQSGDCEKVLSFMDDDITFLANGRKVPSKQVIAKFCSSIPRPFKEATSSKLEIYPLTNETAYTIKTLEYPMDEKTTSLEYVTKIWKKADGHWKITHLHSTVKEFKVSN